MSKDAPHQRDAGAGSRRGRKSRRSSSAVEALGPATHSGQRGRLIFALDATMSRQPTWDTACRCRPTCSGKLPAIGGLDIQLVYFRGLGECRASAWVAGSDTLGRADVRDRLPRRPYPDRQSSERTPGRERDAKSVQALVFVGDAMEEPIDDLCAGRRRAGLLGVPDFMFQEGSDPVAEKAYREIARLSRGAYCRFDTGAAHQLGELLRAVAAYAAGGIKALADLSARKRSRRASSCWRS